MADDGISYVGESTGDNFLDVIFYKGMLGEVETDFVRIIIPGDKTNVIDTVADEIHKRRFARKWQAYEGLQSIGGTPIMEWADVPETLRSEFLYQGFRYVEQVAGAPDSAFSRIMGGVQWRTKAQSFLNRGKVAESDIIKQQAEQLKELQEQMKKMQEQMKQGEKPSGAGPKLGRKTQKEKDEA